MCGADKRGLVGIDSFVGSQKVSCKRALARAFAKYTLKSSGGERASGPRSVRVNA